MKTAATVLRIAALFTALTFGALWFFGGMNTGWTKTSTAVRSVDPVTGLDAIQWETRFLPGLDFLVAGLALSVVLVAVSVVLGRRARGTPV